MLVVVQPLSRVQLFVTSWTAAHQASLFSWSLFKLMSSESVMSANHLTLCVAFSSFPQSFPASGSFPLSRVFSTESALCIKWPMYWSFSLSISPSNEYSGLISFRIDWFDLAAQGILKSLLQHHSLKESILWHSALLYGSVFTSVDEKPYL